MKVEVHDRSPHAKNVFFGDKKVGELALLAKGWKFIYTGDAWSFLSHRSNTQIHEELKDTITMLDITWRLTQ